MGRTGVQLLVVHLQRRKMQKEEKDTLLFQHYSGTHQITTIQVYIQCLYFDKVCLNWTILREINTQGLSFFFFNAYHVLNRRKVLNQIIQLMQREHGRE